MPFNATISLREQIMLKKLVLLITLLILTGLLVGCNTVQGVGKDIEWTGHKGAEILDGK
jgi:predicted small secreted protein